MAEVQGIAMNEKTADNRMFVQASPRPLGTVATFTSIGDSTSSPVSLGGGQLMVVDHHVGDATDQNIYVDFNVKENRTFLCSGYAIWENARFDRISLGIVPKVTSSTPSTGTNFNLYGGYLVVPAAGNGTLALTEAPKLVEIPISVDTGLRSGQAFWDAPYNMSTHTFGDLTACPYGDGTYNIFAQEVCLGAVVRDISLVNQGQMEFRTSDSKELGHNMRLCISCHTDSMEDHEWKGGFGLLLFRANI